MKTAREAFEHWLLTERQSLRLPGITTSGLEADLWRAFKAGAAKADKEILLSQEHASLEEDRG